MGDASEQPLDADGIWAVWRRVALALSARGLLWDTFFSRSVWTQWGVDHVSGLRANRSSRRVFEILAPLSAGDLRRLHLIAAINHRRLEAISRWVAIGFVTVPASTALALSELAPGFLARLRFDARDWVLIGLTGLVVIYYLMTAWRARQVVTVVEFAFIERGASLVAGEDAFEDPLQPPLG